MDVHAQRNSTSAGSWDQPACLGLKCAVTFSVTAQEVQISRWTPWKTRAYRVVRPEVTACFICIVLANIVFDSVSI